MHAHLLVNHVDSKNLFIWLENSDIMVKMSNALSNFYGSGVALSIVEVHHMEASSRFCSAELRLK